MVSTPRHSIVKTMKASLCACDRKRPLELTTSSDGAEPEPAGVAAPALEGAGTGLPAGLLGVETATAAAAAGSAAGTSSSTSSSTSTSSNSSAAGAAAAPLSTPLLGDASAAATAATAGAMRASKRYPSAATTSGYM